VTTFRLVLGRWAECTISQVTVAALFLLESYVALYFCKPRLSHFVLLGPFIYPQLQHHHVRRAYVIGACQSETHLRNIYIVFLP